jgi:ABC-type Mn2+/Zn2+ transport system ATPase subunit
MIAAHPTVASVSQNAAPSALTVEHLSVRYGANTAVENISFVLPSRVVVGMIGPNGAGKTSVLKAILGLTPASGRVLVGGEPVRRRNGQIAYVPQASAVNWRFPATVLDVVLTGRTVHIGWLRRAGSRDREIAYEALRQVGMEQLASRSIGALSGGQQQRVFLARALAQEPAVLLLDEPVSGVDVPTQDRILEIFHDLAVAGRTLLVTTHHLQHLQGHFDLLLCINRRLIAFGPPAEVLTPDVVVQTFGQRLVLRDGTEAAILDGTA